MYWQSEYLREAATMTRNSTYRIDLPEQGLLSALVLEFSAAPVSGASADGVNWRLGDFIGKIEVIGNGATVIKSYNLREADFLCWLHQGIMRPHFWKNYATQTQLDYGLLLFGRMFKDSEFGLDLSRWDNVELRITNSATSSDLGEDISVDIKQIFLREPAGVGFGGYLRSEIWREWTTVVDETKYHTLPVEFPISTIGLLCIPGVDADNVEETALSNLADDIDFKMRGGTRQIFKGGLDHLLIENYLERAAYVMTATQNVTTADKGFDVGIGRVIGGAWGAGSQDGAGAATIPTMEAPRHSFTQKAETSEADSPISSLWYGMAPFNYSWLWHEHNLRPEFLLKPRDDGPVELNIHTRNNSAADNGTNRILLERLVTG